MSGNHLPFKSSGELEAFRKFWQQAVKERLPCSVYIFESADYIILASNKDIKHAQNCLPPNNLRYFDHEIDGSNVKLVSTLASKSYPRLLQQILLAAHCRVFIHNYKNGMFTPTIQASPCDLSEVKEIMFTVSEDGMNDGGYSDKMLGLGPICAIVMEGDSKSPKIGLCFYHEATKTCRAAEFFDNTSHDKLESLLVQFNPMEAIVPDQPKYRTVKKILERNKILVTQFAAQKGGKAKSEADMAKVFEKSHIEEKKAAARAFSHLNQHLTVDLVDEGQKVETIDDDGYVKLNGQAMQGLNIFETASQSMSLFKVLHKTRTTGGERLLRVWLRQPLTNKAKIEERLSIVEEFVNDGGSRKMVHDNMLRKIPDFQSLSVKIEEKKNSLQDLYKCYQGAKEITRLRECLLKMKSKLIEETFVLPLSSKLDKVEKFIDLVEATLDLEAVSSSNMFMVKAEFDDDLMKLGEKKTEIKAEIDTAVNVVARYVGLELKNIKLEFTNQHGYTYRVTMKDEKILRKKQSELMIVDTNKTGVRFRDRKLDKLNKSFLSVSLLKKFYFRRCLRTFSSFRSMMNIMNNRNTS